MAEFVEVMLKKNEMCECYRTCERCPLSQSKNSYELGCGSFVRFHPQEAEKIIMDWEKTVDWSNVKVDTPILVRNHEKSDWVKRYFAKYEDGEVFVWNSGMTSWSADNNKFFTSKFKYSKLAEDSK